jgi:anti-sigma regulatory factor (Ser/Thr protein kinase)
VDSLLIDEWLQGADALEVIDEASLSLVRERVREEATALGLPSTVTGSLVNVSSELTRNQLSHARRGEVAVRSIRRGEVPGLEIIAADRGEGITSPTNALLGPPRSTKSLGVGLAAVLELADEVDVDVRLGEGTCVWARKFAEPVAKQRQVGIFGRPFPGERESGDHAGFVRSGDSLLVGVVDGLGHGAPAREASNLAVRTMRAHAAAPLAELLDAIHHAIADTRGAVMAVSRFTDREHTDTACVGNVSVHLNGPQLARRVSGPSFVLGAPGPVRRIATESCLVGSWDALVVFTDGLSTRADAGDLALLREHPIVIAHQLTERFGRTTDDALVLVVR